MRSEQRPAKQRWLLLFNCQASGLGRCLELYGDGLHVDAHEANRLRGRLPELLAGSDAYDRVIVAQGLERILGFELPFSERVWRVPPIAFRGFHPDMCVTPREGRIPGPLGNCHSLIAMAAFRRGLGVRQALAMYRDEVYAALGYHDTWAREREQLLRSYTATGLDLRDAFLAWSRQGTFMHMTTHPHIRCLADVARALLARAGIAGIANGVVPHDNLAAGPVFAVFPEIGRRLGVAGNYLFKLPGKYRLMDLEAFVDASFAHYRTCGRVEVNPRFADTLARAEALLAAGR